MTKKLNPQERQVVIYASSDGQVKIDVQFQGETVWLTQDQMAELFQKAKSTINEHIKNVYEEKELTESQTMRKFGNSEFSTKPTNYYNLDFLGITKEVLERELERRLVEKIKRFMLELGKGFSFIGNQYRLTLGNNEYFVDLLFFNRNLKYLAENPRHPSLQTHQYSSLYGPEGEKVFEAYAEQDAPAAYRIFFYYGKSRGEIVVFAITPHPLARVERN